jgi:hypothetical protein
MVQRTAIITASGTWTVPADFGPVNRIHAIGGGGGGMSASSGGSRGGGGGAGGAYATIANIALTPGASIPVAVGAGGTGGVFTTMQDTGTAGGDTNFNSGQVIARGGPGGVPGGTAG